MPSAHSYADGYRRRHAVRIGLVSFSQMVVGVALTVGVAR
jgi:hypothetical protein